MAYNQSSTGTYNRNSYQKTGATKGATAHVAGDTTEKKKALFTTGLFRPTKEGVKSLGSVQVKEAITIPAGSYINIYEVDDKSRFKNADTAPDFTLKVTEGKLKSN